MFSRHPVPQFGPMGCGISCLAYLTARDYARARHEFFSKVIGGDWCPCGYNGKAILRALWTADMNWERRRFSRRCPSTKQIRHGNIIAVTMPNGYGHYLVHTPHGWMDSLDPGAEDVTFENWLPCVTGQVRSRLPGWTLRSFFCPSEQDRCGP